MKTQLLSIHAITPLHAGTGQGVGIIDLPIAREKATGVPILPGSSIKGALKVLVDVSSDLPDENERKAQIKSKTTIRNAVFGRANDDKTATIEDNTGAAHFADARLLCLPIRSLRGTFAYATSPYLLERFLDDLELTGETAPTYAIPKPDIQEIVLASETLVVSGTTVALEDLDLTRMAETPAKEWADWLAPRLFPSPRTQERFKNQFAIISDDVMNFLCGVGGGTEVRARICLKKETKTVAKGGLWYEESLPTESVLVSILTAQPLPSHGGMGAPKILEYALPKEVAQFGGKATVGRGLCRILPFAQPTGGQTT